MSPLYHVKEWIGTYETKLPVVLTHDLLADEDIQPPGEKIERGRKKKARAEAGKRATQTPDLIDFSGMGSQAFRGQDCQPTGAGHGYQPKGTQTCGRCGISGHNKLSCPNQPRLRAWDEITPSARIAQAFRPSIGSSISQPSASGTLLESGLLEEADAN